MNARSLVVLALLSTAAGVAGTLLLDVAPLDEPSPPRAAERAGSSVRGPARAGDGVGAPPVTVAVRASVDVGREDVGVPSVATLAPASSAPVVDVGSLAVRLEAALRVRPRDVPAVVELRRALGAVVASPAGLDRVFALVGEEAVDLRAALALVEVVATYGGDAGVGRLVALARDNRTQAHLRARVLEVLGGRPNLPPAARTGLAAALVDEDAVPAVRRATLRTVAERVARGDVEDEPLFAALLVAGAATVDPARRREWLDALGRTGREEAAPALVRASIEGDEATRDVAVAGLARLGGDEARDALLAAVVHDPSPRARLAAVEGLRLRGGPVVDAVLANVAANDADGVVRQVAARGAVGRRAAEGGDRKATIDVR